MRTRVSYATFLAAGPGRGFSDGPTKSLYGILLGVSLFFFPFSLLFVGGGLLPAQFSPMASFIIVLNALITLLSESRSMSLAKATGIFLGMACILFFVEYAGITTGTPFGAYAYTDALGFRVAGVPIAISFAWYATVVTTWRIARFCADRSPSALLVPLTAGLLTVAIDVALEPMASGITAYWQWRTATIPLQNYAAWFAFTFLAALLLQRVRPEPREQTKGHAINAFVLAGMQWVLFMSTDILHGCYAEALFSAGILGFLVALLWLSKREPTPSKETV